MAWPTAASSIGGIAVSEDGAVYVTAASGGTFASPTFTGTVTIGDGSAASATLASNLSGSNDPNVVFGQANIQLNITGSAVAYYIGSTAFNVGSAVGLGWASTSAPAGNHDTAMWRASANSILFNGSATAATTTARTEINKAVTTFTNAVAKATFTITVPNAAHSATIEVEVTGSLGAGGAIGANEASATNSYKISIARTAGVNAVAAISAAYGAAASAVAGAATVTCTAAMSAVSGAVGATNTFTVDVTISRSGGSSDNHTCLCYAKLMNANVTGVTIA